jgi:hypothetical protein
LQFNLIIEIIECRFRAHDAGIRLGDLRLIIRRVDFDQKIA